MGRPSKFTEARREQIVAVLTVGGSRKTAAHISGVSEETLRVWLKRGEDQDDEESGYRQFYERVLAAEAEPLYRALAIVHKALPDKPELAWKVVERREPGYAPPVPGKSNAAPAVQINLSLTGSAQALPAWLEGEVVEGEVIDAQEVPALSSGSEPADQAAPDSP